MPPTFHCAVRLHQPPDPGVPAIYESPPEVARKPLRVLNVRSIRKPRKMWLHYGGGVTSHDGTDLVWHNGKMVRMKPVPVLVSSLPKNAL